MEQVFYSKYQLYLLYTNGRAQLKKHIFSIHIFEQKKKTEKNTIKRENANYPANNLLCNKMSKV